jgi:hypothetical protein
MMVSVLLAWRRIRSAPIGPSMAALVLVSTLLLMIAAVSGGVARRAERIATRVAPATGLAQIRYDIGDQPLYILAPTKDSAVLGYTVVPPPGLMLVSPALALYLQQPSPPGNLHARLPFRITGILEPPFISSPDELVALVGTPDTNSFSGPSVPAPPYQLISVVLILLLLPTLTLLVAALRLDARRRERRLAILWMLGSSQATLRRIAVVEAAMLALPATVGAILLFVLVRPMLAYVHLDGMRFFATDLWPDPVLAMAALAATPLLALGAAEAAFRRVSVNATGLVRRTTHSALRRRRLLPLGIGALLFVGSTLLWQVLPEPVLALGEGMGLLLVIVGIAFAGPLLIQDAARGWLTRSRITGPAILGLRRLERDAMGGFRAITGLTLIAFVFGFATSFDLNAPNNLVSVQEEPLTIELNQRSADRVFNTLDQLRASNPGIRAAPLAHVYAPDGPRVITTCEGFALLTQTHDDGACRPNTGVSVDVARSEELLHIRGAATAQGQGRAEDIPIQGMVRRDTLEPRITARTGIPSIIVMVTPADMPAWKPVRILVFTTSDAEDHAVITAMTQAAPLIQVGHLADLLDVTTQATTITSLLRIVLIYAMTVGAISLLVTIADGQLERRRTTAIAGAIGMGPSGARTQAVWEVAVPLTVTVLPSLLLGVILAVAAGTALAGDVRIPWLEVASALALLLALSMIGVVLLLIMTTRIDIPMILRDDT